MERRVILQLIAAGFIAPAANAQSEKYSPAFFTAEEMETLDRLAEILIPADGHSPGASAALVNRFIDVLVADVPEAGKTIWRDGLAAVDAEAQQRFQKPFRASQPAQQDEVVAFMARNELNPSTGIERFFRVLKRMTIDGYYTSKIGIHQELEYNGNTALSEFAGCTHPEHQA